MVLRCAITIRQATMLQQRMMGCSTIAVWLTPAQTACRSRVNGRHDPRDCDGCADQLKRAPFVSKSTQQGAEPVHQVWAEISSDLLIAVDTSSPSSCSIE